MNLEKIDAKRDVSPSSDKLSEKTKYCNMLECLKKNDIGKEYAMRMVTEKTKQERTVMSIPDKRDD